MLRLVAEILDGAFWMVLCFVSWVVGVSLIIALQIMAARCS